MIGAKFKLLVKHEHGSAKEKKHEYESESHQEVIAMEKRYVQINCAVPLCSRRDEGLCANENK